MNEKETFFFEIRGRLKVGRVDLATGKRSELFETKTVVGRPLVSADGRTLVTYGLIPKKDGKKGEFVLEVQAWDVEQAKVRTTLLLPWPSKLHLAPDGLSLVHGGPGLGDITVTLWDLTTGKERAVLAPRLTPGFHPDPYFRVFLRRQDAGHRRLAFGHSLVGGGDRAVAGHAHRPQRGRPRRAGPGVFAGRQQTDELRRWKSSSGTPPEAVNP